MYSSGPRLSFSKLKYFSQLLDCSVSSLKYSVYPRGFFRKSLVLNEPCSYITNYSSRYFSTEDTFESPFQNINFEAIANGDEELLKKLKVIVLEAEVMRQEGMRVPSVISDEKWLELLNAPTRSKRMKQLAFWWLNEKKKESEKKKRAESRKKREELLSQTEDKRKTDHIYYGLGGSTLFFRIYDTTIDNFHNTKLVRSMMFGQNLIMDCSYDEHMTPIEASLCASQLKILFADNRLQNDPFNIHFCNVNRNGNVFKKLIKHIPTLYDAAFPINITEKSCLELFPKERLVYLTPHCREDLHEFNFDDIYIVGAMVDKTSSQPLSLGKAKSQGLRMARLPLDKYLDWGVGGKSLTLNQIVLILHELKTSGNWAKALEHVPKRKIKEEDFEEKRYSSPRKLAFKKFVA